jgi:hypothetical protein
MGKLLDPHHWSRAVDEMWALVPARGNVMPGTNLAAFFSVACKALEQLVADKDFDADLNVLAKLVSVAPGVPPKDTNDFRRFLESFLASEHALLIQSKMNEEAAADAGSVAAATPSTHATVAPQRSTLCGRAQRACCADGP